MTIFRKTPFRWVSSAFLPSDDFRTARAYRYGTSRRYWAVAWSLKLCFSLVGPLNNAQSRSWSDQSYFSM